MISDEEKELVRRETDIVELVSETVELRPRGRELWGRCPFHDDHDPSFKVNPEFGTWRCWSCGLKGDAFDFVMQRDKLEFPDAIRFLAERAGIELHESATAGSGPKKGRLHEALGEAESFYSMMLLRGKGEGPAAARAYLGGRGLGSEVCRRWGLGFAPGRGALVAHLRSKGFTYQEIEAANLGVRRGSRLQDRFYDRVMFPIHDELGRAVGFGGRIMGQGNPKYINTADTTVFSKRRNLFALDRAKEAIASTGDAVVCEGYTDVIGMHEAGFANAVATLGTALTSEHIKALSRFAKRIIFIFDGDAAGQKAAEGAIQFLEETKAALMCVILPDDLDPADFLDKRGAEAMAEQLAGAKPLMDFVIEKKLSGFDLSSPGSRVAALDELAKTLSPLRRSMLLDGYATTIADVLGMDAAETKRYIREKPASKGAQASRPSGPRPQRRARERGQDQSLPPTDAYERGGNMQDGYVPDDYVPEDGDWQQGGAQATPVAVSAGGGRAHALDQEERRQIALERELLSQMALDPEAARPHGPRIASFSWADPRHETIAWAILATPDGSSPIDALDAACAVVPEAVDILTSGTLEATSELSEDKKMAVLLDSLELASTNKRIRELQGRLRLGGATMGANEVEAVFSEATELQRRANELTKKLSSV